jgi:hypothetical protein
MSLGFLRELTFPPIPIPFLSVSIGIKIVELNLNTKRVILKLTSFSYSVCRGRGDNRSTVVGSGDSGFSWEVSEAWIQVLGKVVVGMRVERLVTMGFTDGSLKVVFSDAAWCSGNLCDHPQI